MRSAQGNGNSISALAINTPAITRVNSNSPLHGISEATSGSRYRGQAISPTRSPVKQVEDLSRSSSVSPKHGRYVSSGAAAAATSTIESKFTKSTAKNNLALFDSKFDVSAGDNVSVLLEQASMTESDLLKRNIAALMETINEERDARRTLEEEYQVYRETQAELLAAREVELEDKKLELLRLAGQLRSLGGKGTPNMEEAVEIMEKHVQRSVKEAEMLRQELASTQMRLMDALEGGNGVHSGASCGSTEGKEDENNLAMYGKYERRDALPHENPTPDAYTSEFEAAMRGNKDAAAAASESVYAAATRANASKLNYRRLQRDYEALWHELEDLRSKERRYEIGNRINADNSKRLRKTMEECQKLKDAYRGERSTCEEQCRLSGISK